MSYGKMVCERNADIIRFLLDNVQAVRHIDRVNELLIVQDDESQTIWHFTAMRGNVETLEYDNEKLTTEEVNNRP
jgi:ankyrin repeat protein